MTTSAFIPTNQTMTVAAGLQQGIDLVRQGIDQINRNFHICDTARSTSAGADDTVFETGNALGLTLIGTTSGRGAAFFSALNSLQTALNASDVTGNLPKLDQGSAAAITG